VKLQFDTATWASTHAATLHWGQNGVEVDSLNCAIAAMVASFVNGFIPKQGNANLDVAVDNLNVADVVALTQSDINASGLISFNIHGTGSLENPRFNGAFGATELIYNGAPVPEVHGNIEYANQTLSGRAEAMRAGEAPFVIAEERSPSICPHRVIGSRFPADSRSRSTSPPTVCRSI